MTAICPQCGEIMLPSDWDTAHPKRMSRDHILPRARGGQWILHGDTVNWRLMCQECNGIIAAVGHCAGAAACVRAVAQDTCERWPEVLRAWKTAAKQSVVRAAQDLRP